MRQARDCGVPADPGCERLSLVVLIVASHLLPLPQNFGYNTREVTVLALSVLTAGLVVAYRQDAGLPPSAWTVMGPLLGWRFIHELWASLNALPPRLADAVDSSRNHP